MLPADAKITSEILCWGALILAAIDAGFVSILAWRIAQLRFSNNANNNHIRILDNFSIQRNLPKTITPCRQLRKKEQRPCIFEVKRITMEREAPARATDGVILE